MLGKLILRKVNTNLGQESCDFSRTLARRRQVACTQQPPNEHHSPGTTERFPSLDPAASLRKQTHDIGHSDRTSDTSNSVSVDHDDRQAAQPPTLVATSFRPVKSRRHGHGHNRDNVDDARVDDSKSRRRSALNVLQRNSTHCDTRQCSFS